MDNKYKNRLLQCEDLSTFLAMFFGLSKKEQLSIFKNDFTINKGTTLYRVRKDDGRTDFQSPEAWMPPPADKISKGRFNDKNEQILYVSSVYDWLEREVSLKLGDSYYLATYVCKKSFKVGSLLSENNIIGDILHCVARSIESSSCLTGEEQEEFNKIKPINITSQNIILNLQAPFYIHKEIKKLYDITNKIGKLVLSNNKNGIRYSSAFDPFELTGGGTVFTLDGLQRANFALTEEGRKNIEFVKAERKICNLDYSLDVFFKVQNEMEEEND